MRWKNLTVESEEGTHLPGFRDPARVRTFDAPEALGVRFYEVNARSAINEVPKRSRMPFRYTINPYRGCAHACVYCLGGDTPILMASGRTKPLSEIRPGDRIYGTVREGRYRRYAVTEVLDHWETCKKPYRVTLTDGTELIASADHRFLTGRGWKHVIGTEQGRRRRPHLTTNNELVGSGSFASAPEHSPDYERGYLCGMFRGDGHIGSYSYERSGRKNGTVHRFRLALADQDGLARASEYLARAGVSVHEFEFAAAEPGRRRAIHAVRTSSEQGVARSHELIVWPRSPSDDWAKGFLAGMFDAEGSNVGTIRISNTDPSIIGQIRSCLDRFGFQATTEDYDKPNGLETIRLRGGLPERLRFCHLTDPAIRRKRSIEGAALKGPGRLEVVSIEPSGGPAPLFDITTGTGDFIADGVVSHNCFARPTHTYLDLNAGEDFEREIVVKVNVPERLRADLGRRSWQGEHVALGTNTDPYQWVEGRYRLMEGIWEAMRDYSNPCSVLTKSPLLLRDLPIFEQLVERTEFVANLSIPTLDERPWRETEPHTPHPRKRIEAVGELARAGIPVGVLIAPLMPGVNDSPEQVERILELVGEAGARSVGGIGLHLRGEVRELWFDWLRQYRPDLVPRYEELYRRGAYLPTDESRRISTLVRGRDGRGRSGPERSVRRTRGRSVGSAGGRGGSRRPEPPANAQPKLWE